MPIDPTGTSPTPLMEAEERPKLHLKCKRGGCDSMVAEEVKVPGNTTSSGRHMYRCIKCNSTTTVNIGGSFEF